MDVIPGATFYTLLYATGLHEVLVTDCDLVSGTRCGLSLNVRHYTRCQGEHWPEGRREREEKGVRGKLTPKTSYFSMLHIWTPTVPRTPLQIKFCVN